MPWPFAGRWKTLTAASLGMGFSQASLTVGTFGVFILPLATDFQWSRAEVSLGLTLSTLSLALATPVVGAIVDKVGPVRVLLTSSALFGCAFIALSIQTGTLGYFYALCIAAAVAGAGTNALVHTGMVAARYQDRLGLALGLALAGVGVVSAALPPGVQWIILQAGWRGGYVLLAMLCYAVSWAVALHYSYVLRRESRDQADRSSLQSPDDNSQPVSIRQILRDRNFLVLTTLFITLSAGFTATNIHLVPILVERNMSAQSAAVFAGLIGVGLVIGRIAAGALMDHFFAPRVALWLFLLTAAGILGLSLQPPPALLVFVAISLGFGTAAEIDLMAFLTVRYFGQANYGKIYGFFYACFMVGAAAGPLLMGHGFDLFNGYELPLLLNVAVLVVAALMTLLLGPYSTPASQGETHA